MPSIGQTRRQNILVVRHFFINLCSSDHSPGNVENHRSRKVALHKHVLVGRLDTGRRAHDVGDGSSGCNCNHIAVAHSFLAIFLRTIDESIFELWALRLFSVLLKHLDSV